MLFDVGGGVVDGLFDSSDIEPRVLFGVLLGVSEETSLTATFLSKSFGNICLATTGVFSEKKGNKCF